MSYSSCIAIAIPAETMPQLVKLAENDDVRAALCRATIKKGRAFDYRGDHYPAYIEAYYIIWDYVNYWHTSAGYKEIDQFINDLENYKFIRIGEVTEDIVYETIGEIEFPGLELDRFINTDNIGDSPLILFTDICKENKEENA